MGLLTRAWDCNNAGVLDRALANRYTLGTSQRALKDERNAIFHTLTIACRKTTLGHVGGGRGVLKGVWQSCSKFGGTWLLSFGEDKMDMKILREICTFVVLLALICIQGEWIFRVAKLRSLFLLCSCALKWYSEILLLHVPSLCRGYSYRVWYVLQ